MLSWDLCVGLLMIDMLTKRYVLWWKWRQGISHGGGRSWANTYYRNFFPPEWTERIEHVKASRGKKRNWTAVTPFCFNVVLIQESVIHATEYHPELSSSPSKACHPLTPITKPLRINHLIGLIAMLENALTTVMNRNDESKSHKSRTGRMNMYVNPCKYALWH